MNRASSCLVRRLPALAGLIGILALQVLAPREAQAVAIAHAEVTVSNVVISVSGGSVTQDGTTTTGADASASNSLPESDSDPGTTTGSATEASASVTNASGTSNADASSGEASGEADAQADDLVPQADALALATLTLPFEVTAAEAVELAISLEVDGLLEVLVNPVGKALAIIETTVWLLDEDNAEIAQLMVWTNQLACAVPPDPVLQCDTIDIEIVALELTTDPVEILPNVPMKVQVEAVAKVEAETPEPTTFLLVAGGLVGLSLARRGERRS